MSLRQRVEGVIERSDAPMLVLAAVAVLIYLGELQGLWIALDVESAYHAVAMTLDGIFVLDLLIKLAVLRGRYLKSPWFVIDLVSAVPAISWLAHGTSALEGVRLMRGFRFFRVLRTLRSLRLMRMLRVFRVMGVEDGVPTPEGRLFDRALTVAVLVYTAVFLGLVYWAEHTAPTVEVAHFAEFWLVVGSLLGMALILVVVRFQIRDVSVRQVRALLNVALPMQVADHLMEHPEAYDEAVRMPATVIFCDLIGFTRTVEGLQGDLDALKEHLEGAMDAIVRVHQDQDLIVDKFIGDAVMSFRGGQLVSGNPREHAVRAVRAAIYTPRALQELADPYFFRVKVGGASMGDALIGTFGTSLRLSYTILGDRVNVASRLEAACGHLGAANLFCRETHELTQGEPGLWWRRVGELAVKGKARTIEAFEAFDQEPAWLEGFHQAVQHFQARRFDEARQGFAAVEAQREGGDGPSRFYMRLLDGLISEPPSKGWRPVLYVGK